MNNGDVDAFPAPCAQPFGDGRMATGGLTKRELFAAMAMQGIVSNPTTQGSTPASIGEVSVMIADGLLARLDATASKSAGGL